MVFPYTPNNVTITIYRDHDGRYWIDEKDIKQLAPDLDLDSSKTMVITIKRKFHCVNCGRDWNRSSKGEPKACPYCRNKYDRKVGVAKLGRPFKASPSALSKTNEMNKK